MVCLGSVGVKGHKRPASDFQSVVSPDRLGVTTKCGCPAQKAGNLVVTNTKVGRDIHAFMREVVCHLQAFSAPGDDARSTNGITDEVLLLKSG